jgi:hypothetical protein
VLTRYDSGEYLKYTARTAADFDDGLRGQFVPLDHSQHLACLKRRVFQMPCASCLLIGSGRRASGGWLFTDGSSKIDYAAMSTHNGRLSFA